MVTACVFSGLRCNVLEVVNVSADCYPVMLVNIYFMHGMMENEEQQWKLSVTKG